MWTIRTEDYDIIQTVFSKKWIDFMLWDCIDGYHWTIFDYDRQTNDLQIKAFAEEQSVYLNDQNGESSIPETIALKNIRLFVDALSDKFVFIHSNGKLIHPKALQEESLFERYECHMLLVIYFKNSWILKLLGRCRNIFLLRGIKLKK